MSKSMKRIHKVVIKHLPDDQPNQIGIRAEAEVSFPLSEMHTAKCIEINEKRARYTCECSSKDSLIQHLKSGGLWGIEIDPSWSEQGMTRTYLADIEQEQFDELRRVLHQIGFSTRAISATFKDVKRESL